MNKEDLWLPWEKSGSHIVNSKGVQVCAVWGNYKEDFIVKAANSFHEREDVMQELITRLTLLDSENNSVLIKKAKELMK